MSKLFFNVAADVVVAVVAEKNGSSKKAINI